MAVAAAVNGEANIVRAPGPCRPSKLRLLVETQYFPGGILSSFIPKQAEQPASRSSNPALANTLSRPSFFACARTEVEPGTNSASIFLAFFRPFKIAAANLKSSIRELVQLPKKT